MLQFVLQLCCSCVAVQVHATQQDTFHWHESFWQLCPTKVATLVLGSHHPHLAKTMEYMSSTTPISRPLKPWPKLRRRNVTSTVVHLETGRANRGLARFVEGMYLAPVLTQGGGYYGVVKGEVVRGKTVRLFVPFRFGWSM